MGKIPPPRPKPGPTELAVVFRFKQGESISEVATNLDMSQTRVSSIIRTWMLAYEAGLGTAVRAESRYVD